MDDAARESFTQGRIRLAGLEYQIAPFTWEHWKEALARYRKTRISVFDVVRADIEKFAAIPGTVDKLLEIAVRTAREGDLVSWADLTGWVAAADNFWFRVWCQIRHNEPAALTAERVQKLVEDEFTGIANREGEVAALEWVTELRIVLGEASVKPAADKLNVPVASSVIPATQPPSGT